VALTTTARDALRALAASPSLPAARAAASATLPPLQHALPVVGAAAADFGSPACGLDLSIIAFAFLDRAADGASLGGANKNISPADIERLEALEQATQDALDDVAALQALLAAAAEAGEGAEEEGAQEVGRAARRAAGRVEALLEELPERARRSTR
jgi:hypothetical protein